MTKPSTKPKRGRTKNELAIRAALHRHGFRTNEILVSIIPPGRGGGFIVIAQVARVEDDGFKLNVTAKGKTVEQAIFNFERNITRTINLMRRALHRIENSPGQQETVKC